MNNSSYHPSKHLSGNGGCRITSSTTPSSVEALEAKISSLGTLRARDASAYSAHTALSKHTIVNNARKGSDIQTLHVPTKSVDCKPGPTLNPASCASGLALIGGFGDGNDLISDLSLTALVKEMNVHQGNTRRRNSTLHNDDWDDLPSSR